MINRRAKELMEFIDVSPTPFQAVDRMKSMLEKEGFMELTHGEAWSLQPGGKYYITQNDSALTAFRMGTKSPEEAGFHVIGAHTDSPCFKIKPMPEMKVENSYMKLNTEAYGGLILNTWLDRPLSVAGRISVKGKHPLQPKMMNINIHKPLVIIPNLAIHMNRTINDGVALNKQKDMLPLFGDVLNGMQKDGAFLRLIAEEAGVDEKDIIDFDLYLYDYMNATLVGKSQEYISASRLDNLAMCHAGLVALLETQATDFTHVLCCTDNEEVGSTTKQGADSPLLAYILERILLSQGKGREEFIRSVSKSFMVSADLAHALHPNVTEKHDPNLRPTLNGGPVIKMSANVSYTSDAYSVAVFEQLCEAAGVKAQKFVNRSDERGGSTIGPISASHLPMNSVDVGSPTLSMHSIRELVGVKDHHDMIEVFKQYFSL